MNRGTVFLRNERGASAAEFALVLPLLLLLMFGIIDAGRYMWEHNRAEKATQMGTRFAVVTELVPDTNTAGSGLEGYNFSAQGGIAAGETVPTSSFDYVRCNKDNCGTCVGAVCGIIGYDAAAFDRIVARMAAMYPAITDANVIIEYRNVGLGYAGDPYGPDVAPLVTIRLTSMSFQPITTMLFGGAITMPDFRSALTLEDGQGTVSN